MCYIARQTRAAMLDSINQEYIKICAGQGPRPIRSFLSMLCATPLIPVITYLGPLVAFTLRRFFVVEKVLYHFPGWDVTLSSRFKNRDYPVIRGTTIFLAAFIIVMNLVVDILYQLVDPRISLERGGK